MINSPEVDDVIEFESSNFAYQFSVTVRFWVDLKTSKSKSNLKLINNKYKLVSINDQNEVNNKRINTNSIRFANENDAMIDEGNTTMTGSNNTDNEMHKPTHEGNKTENGDEAAQIYGDIIETTTEVEENVLETATSSVTEIHSIEMGQTTKDDKLVQSNSFISSSVIVCP